MSFYENVKRYFNHKNSFVFLDIFNDFLLKKKTYLQKYEYSKKKTTNKSFFSYKKRFFMVYLTISRTIQIKFLNAKTRWGRGSL